MKIPVFLFIPILLTSLLGSGCGEKDAPPACAPSETPNSVKGVPTDLKPLWHDLCKRGAWLHKAEEADLIAGRASQGRVGDYAIGNGDVRFIIQGPDRHSGPCPWGGNVIDADIVRPKGEPGHDVFGEYCLLYNLGRTIKTEAFEILNDGQNGGPAVLAVTGRDTLLDFINVSSVVEQYLGVKIELAFDADKPVPLQVTRYYVLPQTGTVLHVITALHNTGKNELLLSVGELLDSGGDVEFFSSTSKIGGFGYKTSSVDPLDFMAFRGEASSHLLAPPLNNDGPGASNLAVAGVVGVISGTAEGAGFLTTPQTKVAEHPATLHIAPGGVAVKTHLIAIGDGSLASATGAMWRARGVKTGTLHGVVQDDHGEGIAGLRVSVLKPSGEALTQILSDADGELSADLPVGDWRLASMDRGYRTASPQAFSIVAEQPLEGVVLQVTRPGSLDVTIRTPSGQATPAKITVYCEGKCSEVVTSSFADVTFDPLPSDVAAVVFAAMDGAVKIDLPPGGYRVIATHGPAWTIWPTNAHLAGGAPYKVVAGESTDVQAVLGKAVETEGWMSGDLHVHCINSPDSPVTKTDRVRSFLGEGVDILVNTDHDYISDLSPEITTAGAQAALVAIPGVETTTFDYGHFNAFPLHRDPADLRGGALDWGNGAGLNLHPTQIREGLSAQGDAPIVQINHPVSGYLAAIQADVSSGTSLADPRKFRITPADQAPPSGDTGLFDRNFDAIELLNGYSLNKFRKVLNWWFALLSRGLLWTATADSDTHKMHSAQAGGPRTWIYMGQGKDTPKTFDRKRFTQQLRAMAAFGSNGPFLRVTASNAKGQEASLGETLSLQKGETVKLKIDLQAPAWMSLSSVELYDTPLHTAPAAGTVSDAVVKPDQWKKLTLNKDDLTDGVDKKTTRWQHTVTMTTTAQTDGYLVVMVKGDKAMPRALVGGRKVTPLAFTNPIFLDVDGGGYDHPPLKFSPPPPPPPPPLRSRGPTFKDLETILRGLRHPH